MGHANELAAIEKPRDQLNARPAAAAGLAPMQLSDFESLQHELLTTKAALNAANKELAKSEVRREPREPRGYYGR